MNKIEFSGLFDTRNVYDRIGGVKKFYPDNDLLYGPYASIETAFTELSAKNTAGADSLVQGKTVGIIDSTDGNKIKEYWFAAATGSGTNGAYTVEDLVPKIAEIDISGKADKSEMSVTPGTGGNVDKTTIQLKNGTSATVLTAHQDISNKTNKVSNATNGNFAGLDSNGDLVDSGKKASDFATPADVNEAATQIIGGATTNYNTLGKVETILDDVAHLGVDDGQAVIPDFDSQADTLWKVPQVLSDTEKDDVQNNILGKVAGNGMGKVILKKNVVNGVNTLTQDMFNKGEVGSRVPNTNTIFVIRYDYDLLGESVTIPENCVLQFDGGSLSNGRVVSNYTKIINKPKSLDIVGKIYDINSNELTIKGDIIDREIELYYPLNEGYYDYEIDSYGMINTITAARDLGITDVVLIVNIIYDEANSIFKLATAENHLFTDESAQKLVENLRRLGIYSIKGIKFHSTIDSSVAYSTYMPIYCDYIKAIMSEIKDTDFEVKDVYIANEKRWCGDYNNSAYNDYVQYMVDLATYINNLGYTSRFSFSSMYPMFVAKSDVYDLIHPTFNDYPYGMSFDDSVAKYEDSVVNELILSHTFYCWNRKYNNHTVGISECGCMAKQYALRAPTTWQQNVLGETSYNSQIVFWEMMSDVFRKTKPPFVCLWFVFPISDERIVNKLYNIFITL